MSEVDLVPFASSLTPLTLKRTKVQQLPRRPNESGRRGEGRERQQGEGREGRRERGLQQHRPDDAEAGGRGKGEGERQGLSSVRQARP